jgi:Family of unknown function (DUF6338)
MLESFQSVGVVVVALLPGALYVWAFERLVGRWGIGLSDRVLRFVGVSAVFHAVAAPVTYAAYREVIASGLLARAGPLPAWWWPAVGVYVGVPIVLGSVVAAGAKRRWPWTNYVIGAEPAPRAWDFLFSGQPDGWIRLKLKTGPWIGGAYATADSESPQPYAAGYPEGDLFLPQAAEIDPETGAFVFEGDQVVLRDSGILVRWDEVEYLEFVEA